MPNMDSEVTNIYFEDSGFVIFTTKTNPNGASIVKVSHDTYTQTTLKSLLQKGRGGTYEYVLMLLKPIETVDITNNFYYLKHHDVLYPIDFTWIYEQGTFTFDYAYKGNDLGANYSKTSTIFKTWAPTASSVVLNLYSKGSDTEENADTLCSKALVKDEIGLWKCAISGDLKSTYYTYTITTAYGKHETADMYAKAAGVNGERSMVVDLSSTNPSKWDEDEPIRGTIKATDAVVWEVHVDDFSVSKSSGVPQKHRGKFLAFTHPYTTVNMEAGAPVTCIAHLKELGVTHVQLMPVFDFSTVDDSNPVQYNWGYDPRNFNVPKGSYSTNPYDGNVRIREMKEMILALHNAGIGVIMDVVYNHTFSTTDSFFNLTVPDYYYRKSSGEFMNGSGCGNETASNHVMFKNYMLNSILFWAEEYHIDGFRFDLMRIHDVATMREIRHTLNKNYGKDNVIMYGEGWSALPVRIPFAAGKENARHPKMAGIGMFNDAIRDAVKGEHCFNGTKGFVNGGTLTAKLLGGIEASVGTSENEWGPRFAERSDMVVTYTSAHDNLTLWDKLVGEDFPDKTLCDWDTTEEKYVLMNKMAGAIILTSHGIAFMQAGEELGRTKFGNDNSYCTADGSNAINWNRLKTHATLAKYYEGLIKIRKAFGGFTNLFYSNGSTVAPEACNIYQYDNEIGGKFLSYTLNNSTEGQWQRVAVVLNASDMQKTTKELGCAGWTVIADSSRAGITPLYYEESAYITVPPHGIVIAVAGSIC